MPKVEVLVRENIKKLEAYSSARNEFKGKAQLFLDANESPYGQLNRYPDPSKGALKKALASMKKVSTENIFIGNGSDEVIDLAFRIFCEPGVDKVLAFTPSYGMYKVSAGVNNIDLLELCLNKDFQINLEELSTYYGDSKLKLIFLCSPNNPTGNLIRREDIIQILESFSGILFIDEAYIDFAEKSSCLDLLQVYERLIISQTFSKARGLAAARVGVAYASPAIIDLYNRVKPPYNVSSLNQTAALDALQDELTYQGELQEILQERARLKEALASIDFVEKIYPSDANFILIKVDNAQLRYEQLCSAQIVIRNRHKQIPNCLRITIGSPQENNHLIQTLNQL